MISKIVVCYANKATEKIQPLLNDGWFVKFCIAESITSTDSSKQGTYEAKGHVVEVGEIVFILEKQTC